jgi:hypothetical protein
MECCTSSNYLEEGNIIERYLSTKSFHASEDITSHFRRNDVPSQIKPGFLTNLRVCRALHRFVTEMPMFKGICQHSVVNVYAPAMILSDSILGCRQVDMYLHMMSGDEPEPEALVLAIKRYNMFLSVLPDLEEMPDPTDPIQVAIHEFVVTEYKRHHYKCVVSGDRCSFVNTLSIRYLIDQGRYPLSPDTCMSVCLGSVLSKMRCIERWFKDVKDRANLLHVLKVITICEPPPSYMWTASYIRRTIINDVAYATEEDAKYVLSLPGFGIPYYSSTNPDVKRYSNFHMRLSKLRRAGVAKKEALVMLEPQRPPEDSDPLLAWGRKINNIYYYLLIYAKLHKVWDNPTTSIDFTRLPLTLLQLQHISKYAFGYVPVNRSPRQLSHDIVDRVDNSARISNTVMKAIPSHSLDVIYQPGSVWVNKMATQRHLFKGSGCVGRTIPSKSLDAIQELAIDQGFNHTDALYLCEMLDINIEGVRQNPAVIVETILFHIRIMRVSL